MKNLILVFAVVTTFTACTSTKNEQKTMNEPTTISSSQIEFMPGEGVFIEELIEVRATVVDIDEENRSLAIVDTDDELTVFNATDEVRNFDQISVGDSVVLTGYLGLVMQLAQPGNEIEDSTTQLFARAAPGEQPAMVEVDVVEVLAEITEIDNQTRMVTVTGPKGNSIDLIVPEHIEGFEKLNISDKVNAAYARAFAISVKVVAD